MFECNGITRISGDRSLLGPLDLRIGAGGMTCVLGHNGSGKSTLLKLLARQDLPCFRHGSRSVVSNQHGRLRERRGGLHVDGLHGPRARRFLYYLGACEKRKKRRSKMSRPPLRALPRVRKYLLK